MKCPRCKSRKMSLSLQAGFSKDPVKECLECGFVWFNDGKQCWTLHEGKK